MSCHRRLWWWWWLLFWALRRGRMHGPGGRPKYDHQPARRLIIIIVISRFAFVRLAGPFPPLIGTCVCVCVCVSKEESLRRTDGRATKAPCRHFCRWWSGLDRVGRGERRHDRLHHFLPWISSEGWHHHHHWHDHHRPQSSTSSTLLTTGKGHLGPPTHDGSMTRFRTFSKSPCRRL